MTSFKFFLFSIWCTLNHLQFATFAHDFVYSFLILPIHILASFVASTGFSRRCFAFLTPDTVRSGQLMAKGLGREQRIERKEKRGSDRAKRLGQKTDCGFLYPLSKSLSFLPPSQPYSCNNNIYSLLFDALSWPQKDQLWQKIVSFNHLLSVFMLGSQLFFVLPCHTACQCISRVLREIFPVQLSRILS